jgi:hypothetical protein
MGFFNTRERAALGKSAETRPPGKAREFVRHDFAPRRRPAETDLSGHVQTLMQRVTDGSLQQIDDLIGDLRRRREELLSETARVQREIIEYAKLNQSAMQSNQVITKSLANLNRVLQGAADPGPHEAAADEAGSEHDNEGAGETFAQEPEPQPQPSRAAQADE